MEGRRVKEASEKPYGREREKKGKVLVRSEDE